MGMICPCVQGKVIYIESEDLSNGVAEDPPGYLCAAAI